MNTARSRLFWAMLLLLLIYSLLRMGLLLHMPISVDEATTYNYFTSRSFPYAAQHYPAPNNHVLHSLLTRPFYAPGAGQDVLLRLPAFLFGLGALLLFAHISWRQLRPPMALAAVALFGAIEPILYYSYMARGYALLLFFALTSVELLLGRLRNGRQLGLLVLVTALGIYAVPSYLYFGLAFLLAGGLYLQANNAGSKSILNFALALAGGVLLALLLYLPIILNEGLSAITGNRYVSGEAGISFTGWWNHFSESSAYYLKWQGLIFLLPLLGLLGLLWKPKLMSLGLMSLVVLVMMLITPLLHGVIPFPRIWIYAAPFMVWLPLEMLNALLARRKQWMKASVLLLMLLALGMAYHSVQQIHALESGARAHRQLARSILSKNYQAVVVQEMYAQSFLPYYLKNSPKRAEVQLHIVGNPTFTASELDSIGQHYDLLVMANHLPEEEALRNCAIDSSWYYNLWNEASSHCIRASGDSMVVETN